MALDTIWVVVDRTGADAHWVTFDADDLVEHLPAIVAAQGEPFGSTSICAITLPPWKWIEAGSAAISARGGGVKRQIATVPRIASASTDSAAIAAASGPAAPGRRACRRGTSTKRLAAARLKRTSTAASLRERTSP